jgi:inner membrane protein
VEGPSHVVFGLAGAVALDNALHAWSVCLSGPLLLVVMPSPHCLGPQPATLPEQAAIKLIYYGAAALGALVPDIDNARSTLGRRMGIVSREIQKHAGHRTIFHSLVGLLLTAAVMWAVQQGVALALLRLGWPHTAEALFANVALFGLLVGYLLHLIADSLTLGGVPWLWPSHERFGFPPKRSWRFRSGSRAEPVVVVAVSVAVVLGLFTHHLGI